MISLLTSDAVRRVLPYLLVICMALGCGLYWGHSRATRALTPEINRLTLELEQERAARTAEKLAAVQVALAYTQAAVTDANRLAALLDDEQAAHQQTIKNLRGKINDAAKPIAINDGADAQCVFGAEFVGLWNDAYYVPANRGHAQTAPASGTADATGTGPAVDGQ